MNSQETTCTCDLTVPHQGQCSAERINLRRLRRWLVEMCELVRRSAGLQINPKQMKQIRRAAERVAGLTKAVRLDLPEFPQLPADQAFRLHGPAKVPLYVLQDDIPLLAGPENVREWESQWRTIHVAVEARLDAMEPRKSGNQYTTVAQIDSAASPRTQSRPSITTSNANNTQSWTQVDLDAEIRKYKAEHAVQYKEIREGVAAGRPGAIRAAQKVFGRNKIGRILRVKANAMISKSEVWQEIAEDLRLPRKHAVSRLKGVGLSIAGETSAYMKHKAASHSDSNEVVRSETVSLLRQRLPASEADDVIDKLQRGLTTDSGAREIVDLYDDQRSDAKMKKIPKKP